MIDYSQLAFAKPKPKALDQDVKRAALEAKDKAENAKARIRAAGCCEVRMGNERNWVRCMKRDSQTHHLIGGIGRRNRGERSILAAYKLRVCTACHEDITGKKLQPTTADHNAWTVRYRRIR